MSLSIRQVVRRFANKRPQNESQALRDCGVALEYLDHGAYRVAFSVVGLPLVLKVPLTDCYSDVNHAYREASQIDKMRNDRKYKTLWPYLPKIYYFNWDHGLTLMHRYKVLDSRASRKRSALEKLVMEVTGNKLDPDVDNSGNVGVDEHGNLKLIDLGWFNRKD